MPQYMFYSTKETIFYIYLVKRNTTKYPWQINLFQTPCVLNRLSNTMHGGFFLFLYFINEASFFGF